MRHPFQLPTIYLGWFLLFVGLAIPSHAEPAAVPVKIPNLEQLAKLPASGCTKLIENSYSPDKRFAIGVGAVGGSKPKWEECEDDTFVLAVDKDDDSHGNYLIDVKANRITGVLDASHMGTRDHYNHESAAFIWSEDGRWLVEVQSWKWHTAICTVHRVTAEGGLGARLEFMPMAEKTAREQLRKQVHKLSEEQWRRYGVRIEAPAISAAGIFTARISADFKDPEAELVDLSVTVKLEQSPSGTLSAKLIKAEPVKEEEP